jgi:FTR1 family protein
VFEALVITLREGIEAALVVGIILTYLRTSGRMHLAAWVYWGLGWAVLASMAGAAVLPRLPINEEAYEGTLMVLGAGMVASLVIWMARHARHLKASIEGRIESVAGGGSRAGWGMFALTFLLVVREGVETVLFLAAVHLTTDGLLTLVGGLTGLALAVLFGVAFALGAVRIDLGRFFKVTGGVLMVFALNLLVGGVHEFAEVGVLPIGPRTMAVLGPIVKSQSLFLASLLAIPLFMLVIPSGSRRAQERSWQEMESPERRLRLARARRERTWRGVAAVAGVLVIGSLTVSAMATRFPTETDPPQMLALAGEELRLPVAALEDGKMRRYGVEMGGTTVRFLVLRRGEDLRVAFDACEICGARGYVQDGSHVVCLACAADINPSTIGSAGGCNPLPLPHRLDGDHLVIRAEDLAAHRLAFVRTDGDS